ncbi:S-layer homology domain-containing protein [Sporosarcina sp. 179-K 3D1 HS]|uniref:S-layer homology domain-containing protein n=1 Tax=Sporosarcina sp. 179-K 3D1 HS TaxID=3232169 RepID=UPI0039A2DB30
MKKSSSHKILRATLATTVATGAIVTAAPAFAQAAAPTFSDVKNIPSHHFYEAVTSLAERGVINGYEDGTFRPGQHINRMHAAKIMALALGLDTKNVKDPGFTDVSKSNPYYGHIAALVEAGIISGYEDNTFKPTANLSRAHMAKMIVLGFKFEEEKLGNLPFSDINDKQWHADYIQTLYSNQITTGTTPTTFSPSALVTRGQMASFIYRSEQATKEPEVDQDQLAVEAAAAQLKAGNVIVARGEFATAEAKLAAVQSYVNGLVTIEGVTAKVAAGATANEYVVTLTKGEVTIEKTIAVNFAFAADDRFVTEVKSLNATQVQISFSTAVDKESLFVNGKEGDFKANVTMRSLDGVNAGKLTGELSADGKTLILTAENNLSKRYDVKVDGVKTVTGAAVDKYEATITIAEDKTAPAIVGVEKVSASVVKVKFTEPIASLGTVSYKLANGTEIAEGGNGVTKSFTAGDSEVTFTIGSDVKVNEEVIATIIGAKDQAGNLISPNPTTVSFTKGAADGVAPTVTSITQAGAKTIAIQFSEELISVPVVKVDGYTKTAVKDEKNPTVYTVETDNVLDGAKTIAVSNFTDLSGEKGEAVSKVVTFVKDVDAPKVVSSLVVTDDKDLKEYLEIAFDKDVELGKNSTVDITGGSYVKDFVTTTLANGDLAPKTVVYKDAKDSKKVIRVALGTLLSGKDVEGASYKVDLQFTNVKSAAGENASNTNASFVRGKDGKPETEVKIKVAGIEQGETNDFVVVEFNKAVDAATATNVANYAIDGAVVETATVNSDDLKKVTLKLKADSNTFTGERNVVIQNVKAKGSAVAMEKYEDAVDLVENVAPTISKAALTGTKEITITFSEAVTDATNAIDFSLLVGGKAVSNTVTTSNVSNSTVKVSLNKALTAEELAKGLELKAEDTLDIQDASGNTVRLPLTVAVQQ